MTAPHKAVFINETDDAKAEEKEEEEAKLDGMGRN